MWNLFELTCFTCCCLMFAEGIGDCYPDLCENGGSCIRTRLEEAKYQCICQTGWDGEFCQQKEGNPCSSSPCQNGGLCYDLHIQYLCICNVHWMGSNCEVPTNRRTCGSWEFPCHVGGCIFARKHCDGKKDCKDGSDEQDCVTIKPQPPPPCRSGMFSCSDKSCISSSRRCDRYSDCVNNTDEIGCHYNLLAPVTQPGVVTTNYKAHDTFTGVELAFITGFLLFTMCILLVLFAQKRGFRISRRQQAALMYRRHLRDALDRINVRGCSHYSRDASRADNPYMSDQVIVSYNANGEAIRFGVNAWKHTFHCDSPPPYSDIVDINRETCPLPVNARSSAEMQPPSYDDTVAGYNDTQENNAHERTELHHGRSGGRRQGCDFDFETRI